MKGAGLATPTWTNPSLTGVPLQAIHLTEIRTQLNEAMTRWGITVPNYTDPTIVAGTTVVKAAHVQEIRDKVR